MVDAISRETVSQGQLALKRLLKIRQPGIGLSLFFWTQDQWIKDPLVFAKKVFSSIRPMRPMKVCHTSYW